MLTATVSCFLAIELLALMNYDKDTKTLQQMPMQQYTKDEEIISLLEKKIVKIDRTDTKFYLFSHTTGCTLTINVDKVTVKQ